MPSLIDLRRRIRAVKNTQQITKAMKMVAASKLRRSQERIMNARPYAVQMQRVLSSVASRVDPAIHQLLTTREIGPNSKTLVILVSGDRRVSVGRGLSRRADLQRVPIRDVAARRRRSAAADCARRGRAERRGSFGRRRAGAAGRRRALANRLSVRAVGAGDLQSAAAA